MSLLYSHSLFLLDVRQRYEQYVHVIFRQGTPLWKRQLSSGTFVSLPDPLPGYQFTIFNRDNRQNYSYNIPQHALGLPWIEWRHTDTSRKPLGIYLGILLNRGRAIPVPFCDLEWPGDDGWDAGWLLLQ